MCSASGEDGAGEARETALHLTADLERSAPTAGGRPSAVPAQGRRAKGPQGPGAKGPELASLASPGSGAGTTVWLCRQWDRRKLGGHREEDPPASGASREENGWSSCQGLGGGSVLEKEGVRTGTSPRPHTAAPGPASGLRRGRGSRAGRAGPRWGSVRGLGPQCLGAATPQCPECPGVGSIPCPPNALLRAML